MTMGAGDGTAVFPGPSAPDPWLGTVPGPLREGPVPFEEVLRRFPALRQSLASKFDDCELSALFELRYANGWTSHPAARGTLFHRFAAECLRTMREQDTEGIPVGVALAILEEVCYQRGIPPRDRVRVPLRELPMLEMAARKFAADNHFTVRNIVDVERRLTATLEGVVHWETGEVYSRELTGQIDALIARGADEAVVLDWKDTWMLPPEREEDADDPGVSYHGYFQQLFYGWLVLMTYPAVNAVILREFYVRRTKKRAARLTRAELPKVEQRRRYLISAMDRAVQVGVPRKLDLAVLEEHGSWIPSPGKHCHWCPASRYCPIEEAYRGDGGIETEEQAQRMAARRTVAKSIHKHADRVLQPWAELHGPIPIRSAKGRRVLGYRVLSNGSTRWEEYTPTGQDRPPDQDAVSPNLAGAMRESVAEARRMRDAV
jgi:hypothetical protein